MRHENTENTCLYTSEISGFPPFFLIIVFLPG